MKEVVDMLFKRVEVPSYHLPGVVFETWLLEEFAVAGGAVLQFFYLFQQGAVISVGVPEKDSVVVKHVGFGVIV